MAEKNVKFKDSLGNILYPITKGKNVTNNNGQTLDTVEAGAQVNKLETVTVNGTPLPINNKMVALTIPDWANFVTAAQVSGLIASAGCIKRSIVSSLPISQIDDKTIYMVSKAGAATGDIYTEYMYINGAWEVIGSTAIDITNLVKASELAAVAKSGSYNDLKDKPNISGGVVSATTLAGYGIIDAYTKTEIDSKIITFEIMG